MTLHLSTEDARLLRGILLDFAEAFEDMDEEADRVAVTTRLAPPRPPPAGSPST
jgi:hypothetical protein